MSRIASSCAAKRAAYAVCSSWLVGVESALVLLKKTSVARCSSWPLRSSGTSVLSNVGGAGSATIASISATCSAMPRSNAGAKCSSEISANGGIAKGSWLGAKKGLVTGQP